MADVWFTPAETAQVLGVPLGTVYRWASEDNWPRIAGRPVRYNLQAATASATRRHPELGL